MQFIGITAQHVFLEKPKKKADFQGLKRLYPSVNGIKRCVNPPPTPPTQNPYLSGRPPSKNSLEKWIIEIRQLKVKISQNCKQTLTGSGNQTKSVQSFKIWSGFWHRRLQTDPLDAPRGFQVITRSIHPAKAKFEKISIKMFVPSRNKLTLVSTT